MRKLTKTNTSNVIAVSWVTKRRQPLTYISWLDIIVRAGSGANYLPVWVSMFKVGLFSTGCSFQRRTTRPERERELRGLLQLMVHPNQFAADGADGSFEGRWRLFSANVCVYYAAK